MTKLTSFEFEGQHFSTKFEETQTVKAGVECDIYSFIDNKSMDLAIVRVERGYKTPLQRIRQGNKTVEGFVSGKGVLTVQVGGESKTYSFDDSNIDQPVVVGIGQIVQWEADHDVDLVFSEVCDPPYVDGRFEDLPE